MGVGDWIMATSQVRVMHERVGQPIAVTDPQGRYKWSEVFENNPRIATVWRQGMPRVVSGGGVRAYIQAKGAERWTWRRWDIRPGELYFTESEKNFGAQYAGFWYIEPHTKANVNKAWLWDRWQALVDTSPVRFIQCGPPGTRRLSGVQFVETATFRQAASVLRESAAFVGTEGGLHHAAAALSVPAIVLWSEFIAPEFTGYATQTNIRHAAGWCGMRAPCKTCKESMERITVDEVREAIDALCL